MENTNEKTKIVTRRGQEVSTECTAEFVLPDYKGDIKRIMHTAARALPASRFVGEDSAEFNGVVVFEVLYLSAEDELTSVNFTEDYTVKVPKSDGTEDIKAHTACEGVNIRLPGPRKISARCRTVLKTFEDLYCVAEAVGSTFEDKSEPEALCQVIRSERIITGEKKDREYAQEVAFIKGISIDDVSVLAERAWVKVNSALATENAVALDGEISVGCIIFDDTGKPSQREIKIPFEEQIELSGVEEGMHAVGSGTVVSLNIATLPTDDGVRVNASVIADYETDVFTNTQISVVKDAYSKVYDTENKYKRLGFTEYLDTKKINARISREVDKKDTEAPEASEIIYYHVTPITESVKIEGEEVKINGKIQFSGVACEIKEGDKRNYTSFKLDAQFSEKVNFDLQIPAGASVEYKVDATDARAFIDGEKFYLECEIIVSVVLSCSKTVDCLVSSDINPDRKTEERISTVKVYYPTAGDSLFEIAKEFKTSVSKIAENNALTEKTVSLAGERNIIDSVKKLLIMKM